MGMIGSVLASSAQLKRLETSGSGGFLMEIEYFSIFWRFSVESADAKRVLRIVLTNVGAVCSVGGCNLKSGCNLLFSWVLGYEPEVGSSELADVGSAEG
jgi:hypothetical protein